MYRYLFLSLILIFIYPAVSFSQISFERTYGGDSTDVGHSVQQTTDGGYIIAGSTESFGPDSSNVYLIKTDSSGDTLWTRTYGRDGWDEGYSVQQTTDGGYVIAGSFGAGSWDVWLIKTDSFGDTLWTKTYGGDHWDEGHSVQQTTDGGYIIAGDTRSFGAGYSDIYLIKTNSSGDSLWTKTYGGEEPEYCGSVQQTSPDSGYIIVGSKVDGLSSGVWLIKTNSSGDTLWTGTYGLLSNNAGSSVQQTTDGGYVIAGTAYLSVNGCVNEALSKAFLIKTDSSGGTLWERTYSEDGFNSSGSSVLQTTDGDYVMAGGIGNRFQVTEVYLIKTNSLGDTLWTKTYGGDDIENGYSVKQTSDEGFVIAGYREYIDDFTKDVYLIKTDPDGNVGIADNNPPTIELPRSWTLSQNYPNPFNPSTTIAIDIPGVSGVKQHVVVTVYDIRGRRVKTLIDSELEPGTHKIHWNGRNDRGESVSSGIYLYTLKAGEKYIHGR